MKPELYQQFVACKNRGDKNAARVAVEAFIASFDSFEEKQAWTREFLQRGEYGHVVRHELYESVILPVLLHGYERADAWATFWLARTAGNLYNVKAVHARLNYKSKRSLLLESYALQPSDDVRRALLESEIEWFAFSQHEWPSGILWGMNGASIEQCDEIMESVAFAQTLDTESRYTDFLTEFAAKVEEYKQRLLARETD